MNLQQLVQHRSVIRKLPSAEVLKQLEEGRKFVVVDDDFDQTYIPRGFTLIDMRYRGDSFRTLVPQNLLFYLGNPGEGDGDNALDEIADFYGDAEDFEDDQIAQGATSVQETNWAMMARGSYRTYLVNRLTRHQKLGLVRDSEGEPIPEFDPEELHRLDIDDPYVAERVRAISALVLGKRNEEELKKYELSTVLKHVTIQEDKIERLTAEEFQKVTCWAGSHYEVRPEFRNRDDVDYQVDHRHDRSYMEGTKHIHKREVDVLDAKVSDLEKEIAAHRLAKHGEVGRHDANLIRQYANLAYIAPEKSQVQLDIQPPKKMEEWEKKEEQKKTKEPERKNEPKED